MLKSNYIQQELLFTLANLQPAEPAGRSRLRTDISNSVAPAACALVDDHPLEEGQDEFLDESALTTVLSMLAAMDTVEELDDLNVLTPLQKSQVWAATPDALRARIWQIRQGTRPASIAFTSDTEIQTRSPQSLDRPIPCVGDRIVLKANPSLTRAELMAIFEVIAVEEDVIQVKAVGMSTRRYPVAWALIYP